MKKTTVIIFSLLLCMLLSSCSLNKAIDRIKEINKQDQQNSKKEKTEDGLQTSATDTVQDSPPSPDAEDATYAIYVNDTVKVEKDGLITEFKLVLFATTTGSSLLNTYSAHIRLDYGLDASQLSGLTDAPIEGMGGFNVSQHAENVIFDVVKMDSDTYANYGITAEEDEHVLFPLINGSAMALLTPNMNGTGHLGINISGEIDSNGGSITAESGESSVSASGPLAIKIDFRDGFASVYIPSLSQAMANQKFEGIVTESSDIIDQAEAIAKDEFSKKD